MHEYQPAAALQFRLTHPRVIPMIPGMANPDEVRGAKEWSTWAMAALFRVTWCSRGSVCPEAPLPVSA